MKRLFLILLISLLTFNTFAQNELNQVVIDEMINEEIILGYCDREGLTFEPFNEWFQSEYDYYEMDQETLDMVNNQVLDNVKIKIVLGTWCHDSQREVPRFYKIADYLDFDNFILIGVNRAKIADGTEVDELNIDLVPTFIFYNADEEIGRIIESPTESLEKDIFEIISAI